METDRQTCRETVIWAEEVRTEESQVHSQTDRQTDELIDRWRQTDRHAERP